MLLVFFFVLAELSSSCTKKNKKNKQKTKKTNKTKTTLKLLCAFKFHLSPVCLLSPTSHLSAAVFNSTF